MIQQTWPWHVAVMPRLPWRLLICALAALFSACGGEKFDHIKNLRSAGESIICFGDSLTEGVGADSGEDYPAVLSRELGVPVLNAGVRGDTTREALERIGDAVLSKNPRLVIILLCGNDFLRQLPHQDTRRNLEEIVRRAQESGAMIALVSMRLGLFTDEYAALFDDIARQFGALHIPGVMKGILSDAKLRSDPIHPNGAGYRLLGERIGAKIKPLLREADRLRGSPRAG